ncbi:unnamed protein product [Enterobius vermicularis]|uniref:RUN domain-containing protein n=1 Tax=Enterobius vermicularis TaxID=51028 RepID=A0A0N4VKK3_ENTVE|nr:unnamed protein product [Enterobius vermicularis]
MLYEEKGKEKAQMHAVLSCLARRLKLLSQTAIHSLDKKDFKAEVFGKLKRFENFSVSESSAWRRSALEDDGGSSAVMVLALWIKV